MSITIFLISLLFLIVINLILFKLNFLIDKNIFGSHKISTLSTPLSGGIYFFCIFLIIDNYYQSNYLSVYPILFGFVALGILADSKILNNPKIRFFLQLVLSISLIYYSKITLDSTRIYILDDFLKNQLFNNFFLVFCFMTLLNGSNFIDGVNGFLTSYFLLVIFSIILIGPFSDLALVNYEYLKLYLIPMVCFLILNLLNKNFLGDSGSYFLSVFFGFNLVYFINDNNNQIAPFFIINLLWYPCFENLFTIFRRSKIKSIIYLPDKKHLHTLVYYYLNRNFAKKYSKSTINSLASIMIIIFLIPMFLYSVYFCDSSIKLFYALIVYILSYLYIYFKLLNYEKNNKK